MRWRSRRPPAAWVLLARGAPAFFAAPLPVASTLVSDWKAVRGGNLITTYPDGRVDMVKSGGERRVLAARPSATDYTVAATTTLVSGAGYGVYVRASTDAGTKLTGYCVQLDHGFGQVIVRQVQSDTELSSPLVRYTPPAGFVWFDALHVMGITVLGNTMKVTLDGVPIITIPDLAAASATAAKSSYGLTSAVTAPTAGGYGLRSWGDGAVRLQQLTAGPPE